MNAAFRGLARPILQALDAKKALDIRVLDLKGVASYTDGLVVCSGTSSTHVQALVNNVEDMVPDRPTYKNLSPDDSWCVLDYIHVVVHVFREDVRSYYGIETLWSDARDVNPASL